MPPTTLMPKSSVLIPGYIGPFEASLQPDTWNGWARPLFDRENAEKVVEALNSTAVDLGEHDGITARWDGETLMVKEYGEEYLVSPDAEGLYDIGSDAWTWVPADQGWD